MGLRIDLHTHTSASFDCKVAPSDLLRRCRALGLSPIAVTDHDTIEGALGLERSDPGSVIVGQEVTTRDGEVIGLFLKRAIRSGQPARVAIEEIRAQGGLVYLEHPYDPARRSLREQTIEECAESIDIVEVFNGRSSKDANQRAEDLCATLGAAAGAGSDAHTISEIGGVYIEIEAFAGPGEFLHNLRAARIVQHPRRLILRIRASLTHTSGCR